jgi:hypothetical protein
MSWTITPQTKVPVDPVFNNVSLLLHGNGTNGSTTITDNSPTPKTVTAVGNAQISTAQSKFGGSSIAFDGSGDRLSTNIISAIGTDDFTIEGWIYANNLSSPRGLCCLGDDAVVTGLLVAVTVLGRIGIYGQNAALLIGTTQTILASTWAHVACTRASGTMRIFVNGTQDGSVANTRNYSDTTLLIGAENYNGGFGSEHNGYIDDLRITKGVARYTANFTPPAAPFPDI